MNTKRKRLAAILVALVLGVLMAGPVSASPDQPVTIATATKLNGAFFTSQWGDNTSDTEVRLLVNGYPTVVYTSQNTTAFNPTVVANVEEKAIGEDKLFTIHLKDGLLFDDGSPITAKDYVFSLLLQASPAMRALGGAPADLSHLAGFAEYAQEQTEVFSGVRLLDDLSFSLVLKKDKVPFFYEKSFLLVDPYPMAVLAPDAQVVDTEDGAKLEPALTAELLQQTILDPVSGYLVRPVPGSGPYKLTSYNAEAGEAVFEVNPHFLGNHEGRKPAIPSIKFIHASGDAALKGLQNGSIDIIHKLVDGKLINQGMKLDKVNTAPYARRGFAFFAFDAQSGIASSKAVRRAFAYLVDSAKIAQEYTQGFGWPVYGDYGFGHWAIAEAAGLKAIADLPTEDGKSFAAFDELPFNHYDVHLSRAAALLAGDGWTYNADGEAYKAGQIRHRKTDQGLEPLTLSWLQIDGSKLAQVAQNVIEETCKRAGIQLNVTKVSQQEFFNSYYGNEPKGYDLYLLASNFGQAYDPYYMFMNSKSKAYSLGQAEENLLALAEALRQTPEGDNALFVERFMAYQKEYNEVLPTVPVYSNIYVDLYRNNIYNYRPAVHNSAAVAILYATR